MSMDIAWCWDNPRTKTIWLWYLSIVNEPRYRDEFKRHLDQYDTDKELTKLREKRDAIVESTDPDYFQAQLNYRIFRDILR